MTTTWAADGLTATMVGVERGWIRARTVWVVRFETTSHVVEMTRVELLDFFSGRIVVAESMKRPILAFLCRPSAAAANSAAETALGDLPPDAVVLARTEPAFSTLAVLSPEQGESLAQWIQADPTTHCTQRPV